MIARLLLKIFGITAISLLSTIILLVCFSPYKKAEGYTHKVIISEINIDAPVASVFKYLGNSDNASIWSTYVKNIVTINTNEVEEGLPGSVRRCFGYDEGVVWDEEILMVETNSKRKVSIFNEHGLPMKDSNLCSEQVYSQIREGKTKLKFTLYFNDSKYNFWKELKMHIGAYRTKKIFEKNLINIKKQNENIQA